MYTPATDVSKPDRKSRFNGSMVARLNWSRRAWSIGRALRGCFAKYGVSFSATLIGRSVVMTGWAGALHRVRQIVLCLGVQLVVPRI